jgi:hypothetical protein
VKLFKLKEKREIETGKLSQPEKLYQKYLDALSRYNEKLNKLK